MPCALLPLAATAVVMASPALGQTAEARAALRVEPAVSVSPAQGLLAAAGRASVGGGGLRSATRVLVTGEPGRAYRVTLLATEVAGDPDPTTELVLISGTSGDISETRLGQLDADGRDTLQVLRSATTPVPADDITPTTPIRIDYE
jgi:hypothetical protein